MEVLVVAIRKLPKGHKSVCFVVTQQIGKGKKVLCVFFFFFLEARKS